MDNNTKQCTRCGRIGDFYATLDAIQCELAEARAERDRATKAMNDAISNSGAIAADAEKLRDALWSATQTLRVLANGIRALRPTTDSTSALYYVAEAAGGRARAAYSGPTEHVSPDGTYQCGLCSQRFKLYSDGFPTAHTCPGAKNRATQDNNKRRLDEVIEATQVQVENLPVLPSHMAARMVEAEIDDEMIRRDAEAIGTTPASTKSREADGGQTARSTTPSDPRKVTEPREATGSIPVVGAISSPVSAGDNEKAVPASKGGLRTDTDLTEVDSWTGNEGPAGYSTGMVAQPSGTAPSSISVMGVQTASSRWLEVGDICIKHNKGWCTTCSALDSLELAAAEIDRLETDRDIWKKIATGVNKYTVPTNDSSVCVACGFKSEDCSCPVNYSDSGAGTESPKATPVPAEPSEHRAGSDNPDVPAPDISSGEKAKREFIATLKDLGSSPEVIAMAEATPASVNAGIPCGAICPGSFQGLDHCTVCGAAADELHIFRCSDHCTHTLPDYLGAIGYSGGSDVNTYCGRLIGGGCFSPSLPCGLLLHHNGNCQPVLRVRPPCNHAKLTFGSGGYYIFCSTCGAHWVPADGQLDKCTTNAVISGDDDARIVDPKSTRTA